MAGPNNAANQAARQQLYLSRAQNGIVLGRTIAFYPGAPTTPNSFTGNLALGASSGGPASFLVNGAGPPIVAPIPCDVPVISEVVVSILPDNISIIVTYSNPDPDTDIYLLFAPSTGSSFGAVQTTPGPGLDQVTLLFPDEDVLPGGVYSLKIMRASDPKRCFGLRTNVVAVEGFVCTLDITTMTGDGIFPNPAIVAGTTNNTIALVGVGFLSGTILADILRVFGGPPGVPLPVDMVTVIDDNNLTIQLDTLITSTGGYGVRLTLFEEPTCMAEIGFVPLEPFISVTSI